MFSKVPSTFMRSMLDIFLMARRMVPKLVSMPPLQRSVTYGMPVGFTLAVTMSLACFLVATKSTFLPLRVIWRKALAASSNLTEVLLRSMMWIPFFSAKM